MTINKTRRRATVPAMPRGVSLGGVDSRPTIAAPVPIPAASDATSPHPTTALAAPNQPTSGGSTSPPVTTELSIPRAVPSRGDQATGRQSTTDAHAICAAGSDVPDRAAIDQPKPMAVALHDPALERCPTMTSLHDPALVFAADILDDIETVKNANANRLRQMTRSVEDKDGEVRGFGYDETHPDVARLAAMVEALARLEHDAELNLARHLRRHSLGNWVKAHKGVGEKQAARLLAAIGDPYIRPEWTRADGTIVPEGPRTVSALWAYCGLHVLPIGGHSVRDTPRAPAADRNQPPAGQRSNDAQSSAASRDQLPDHHGGDTYIATVGDAGGDPGHAVNDAQREHVGVAPKRTRNQQSNWSETARKRVWLVADACRKILIKPCTGVVEDSYAEHVPDCKCSPYRLVYDAGRLKYAEAKHETPCVRCGPKGKPAEIGSPLSAAHQDARARRLMMKEILKDLWREARRLHEPGTPGQTSDDNQRSTAGGAA